jgi:selenide,water dikinase
MSTLNRGAADAMIEVGVNAATDVTGFGLLGHLREMLVAGGVGARLSAGAVPLLAGARELAAEGVAPGGTKKNLLAARSDGMRVESGVGEADLLLLADAQTSGGLLMAVAPDRAEALCRRLEDLSAPSAAVVGEITEKPGLSIEP